MKIGISGASGQLGQAIVEELVGRGTAHHIVGISRSPEHLSAPAEGRVGNYDAPDTLVQAYAGLDRLAIIPSAELEPGVRGRQLQAAIDAADRAGVGHVYLLSAAGTREAAEPAMGETYWTGEQHLIRTAPRWTILRMNYYAESILDEIKMSLGMGVLAGLGDERVAYVSRRDVAAATAGALLGDGHAGAIYNLTGTQTLSGEERAALVSQITGTPVAFVTVSPEQLRHQLAQAGLPPVMVEAIIEIKQNFTTGAFDIVTQDVARLAGHAPAPLRELLAAALA